MAEATKRSTAWVKQWKRRLRAPVLDHAVFFGHPCARKTPPPRVAPPVVERILALRDQPPANLQRTPGPRTIRALLVRDPAFQQLGQALPAPATIWRILDQHQRILRPRAHHHEPLPRGAPMQSWQLDFKDASSVPPDPGGKRQHVVEVLNTVDTGTSILVEAQPRADFTAETTLQAVAALVAPHGLPEQVQFDREPRFVGAWTKRDFPAPFVRFWLCLGVEPTICPPQRPDKNAFVERYHRTYKYECLQVHQPDSVEQVCAVTADFKQHYNFERPHLGVSCQGHPPRVAFPDLPALPKPPALIDPDAWLGHSDGRPYVRKVTVDGTVKLDDQPYYGGTAYAGRKVTVRVLAGSKEFVAVSDGQEIKRWPIKGLIGTVLLYTEWVELLSLLARRQHWS
jgi:transposase InsO family protein